MIDLFPNETFFILLAIFLVVLWTLNRLIFRPTVKLIEYREAQGYRLKIQSEELSQETEQKMKIYEEGLQKGRMEAARERERLIRESREEARKLLDEARRDNEKSLSRIREEIDSAKMGAAESLKVFAGQLAKDVAGRVLERGTMIVFLLIVLLAGNSRLAWATEETHAADGLSVSFLFRVLNFIVLLVILYFVLKKPARDFFANRSLGLKSAVNDARKAMAVSKKQYEEIGMRLKNLETEKRSLLKTFREEGNQERLKIIEEAHAQGQRIKQDLDRISAGEVKKAKEELRRLTMELARESALSISKKEMNSTDEKRITGNYISRLKEMSRSL